MFRTGITTNVELTKAVQLTLFAMAAFIGLQPTVFGQVATKTSVPTDTVAAPPSVIVDLEDRLDKFREAAGKQAVQAWNTIGDPDSLAIQAARKAHSHYARHPDDPKARADFEEAFAAALKDVDQDIEAFLQTQKAVVATFTELEKDLQGQIAGEKRQYGRHKEHAQEYRQESRGFLKQLHELKARFPELDQPATQLPSEVQFAVVKLNNQRQNAERQRLLAESRAISALENQADLEATLTAAKQMWGELDTRFSIATDDQTLIADIAAHGVDAMRRHRVRGQRNQLTADRDRLKPLGGEAIWSATFGEIEQRIATFRKRGEVRPAGNVETNRKATDILSHLPPLDDENLAGEMTAEPVEATP